MDGHFYVAVVITEGQFYTFIFDQEKFPSPSEVATKFLIETETIHDLEDPQLSEWIGKVIEECPIQVKYHKKSEIETIRSKQTKRMLVDLNSDGTSWRFSNIRNKMLKNVHPNLSEKQLKRSDYQFTEYDFNRLSDNDFVEFYEYYVLRKFVQG